MDEYLSAFAGDLQRRRRTLSRFNILDKQEIWETFTCDEEGESFRQGKASPKGEMGRKSLKFFQGGIDRNWYV